MPDGTDVPRGSACRTRGDDGTKDRDRERHRDLRRRLGRLQPAAHRRELREGTHAVSWPDRARPARAGDSEWTAERARPRSKRRLPGGSPGVRGADLSRGHDPRQVDGGGGSSIHVPPRDGCGSAAHRGDEPGRRGGPAWHRRLAGGVAAGVACGRFGRSTGGLMRGLGGKVAVVTGAGGGIGSAVSRRLAEEGAGVACTDVDVGAAEIVANEIRERGGRAIAIEHDVTRRESWEGVVARTQRELGSLDIVVNNAGFTRDRTVLKMTDEEWQAVIDVHLLGCFLGCQYGLRAMKDRGWGRIVSLSSTAAFGWFGQTNYSAAKAGIIGITKTVAMEAAKYGVNVNAIAPGSVDTPMLRAVPSERLRERSEERRVGKG